MTSGCQNDCVEPFEFPKKIDNRPGLSQIDYRIGTYADFLAAIFRELNQNEVLKNWTHREPDDPGIALLEGVAVLGDILTFYQQLYANEAFLRTAQWRDSIANLVRLLGYQLSPGVGGKATFAFTLKGNQPVVIPRGFSLKAQLEDLPQLVEFETTSEVKAYPELSQFNLYRPARLSKIDKGTKVFSIESKFLKDNNLELNKRDQLLLVENPNQSLTKFQTVVIKDIKQRFDRTEIYIEGSWQGGFLGQNISAYKIGRSFRHYGHNSPPSFITVQGETTVERIVPFRRQINGFFQGMNLSQFELQATTNSRGIQNINAKALSNFANIPNLSFTFMPLDAEVNDLSVGGTFLILLNLQTNSGEGVVNSSKHFFERQINRIYQTSLTWGALTAGTTIVDINKTLASGTLNYTDIRSMEFLEVMGERFLLQGTYQEQSTNRLKMLFYFGNSQTYKQLHERTLALVKTDGTHETLSVTIDKTKIDSDNRLKFRPLYLPEFSEDFSIHDFPLFAEPKVTVYGNLVMANQGKTERETVLGNGDSRQKFQTFKLPKAPLTYHTVPSETPSEVPQLQIYVSDRLWQQVPSLYNHKPEEEIYIVREDANGDSWVQFGDGKTGKQLPSGIKNVVAKSYRTGIGAYGKLKPNTKVQATAQLDHLDKIYLPGMVTGGALPESGENAKQAAPGKIQSLNRLVSLQDFESETLGIAGVSKALAGWELVDNIPSLVLTVLMETGRTQEFTQVQQILANYNRCRGPQRFPIQVQQGKQKYVYMVVHVALDPTFRQEQVQTAIQAALGVTGENQGLFSLKTRRFGQKEYATRIAGTLQNVAGVLWVEVKTLMSLGTGDSPPELGLSQRLTLNLQISCNPQEILSLSREHLHLRFISPPSLQPC